MSTPNNAFGSCPSLKDTRECNTHECAVHCEVGSWGAWEECQVTCGLGVQIRERERLTAQKHGGEKCPPLEQRASCNAGPCPVHCEVGTWASWSNCDKKCGVGSKKRERHVILHPSINGTVCPDLEQEAQCVDKQCPVDCEVGDWTVWGGCSVTCGYGKQTRSRGEKVIAQYDGKICPDLDQETDCDRGPCPVDCWTSPWGIYSACTKTCGDGKQTRTRTILRKATDSGTVCPALSETVDCRARDCPTDCVIKEWSEWSKCTKSCGTGTKSRQREITTKPAFGGKACPISENMEVCNGQACPVDCVVGQYGAWSECSRSCGQGGRRVRKRSEVTKALNGGSECPELDEMESCTLGACPIHCVVGPFGDWDNCDVTCGGGTTRRTRRIITNRQHQGDACPDLVDSASCNTQACPINCNVGTWSKWEPEYQATINGDSMNGRLIRRRDVLISPSNGGVRCPPVVEHQNHNGKTCAEHDAFGDWSECTKGCGIGYQYRYKEHITCANEAVVKYHMRMRQGRHCNSHECAPGETASTISVVVPAIKQSI